MAGLREPDAIEQSSGAAQAAAQSGVVDRIARQLVLRVLASLRMGSLTLDEDGARLHFGEAPAPDRIAAHLRVHDISMYRDILLRGSIGAGEAYMRGAWSSPDLTAVIRLMALNLDALDDMDGRRFSSRKVFTALSKLSLRLLHALRSNTRSGARKNIAAHYDLGNTFYQLFLDPSMMYSAAIFPHADSTLEQASLYKIDRICRKLQLRASDHLLEIGTGWGGLAIHAAKHYGCRVTTTTISREQYEFARQRIDSEGLGDRIELLLSDYRDLRGQYDKLVSVEMIEAVGHEYYRTYFEQCARLLHEPDH